MAPILLLFVYCVLILLASLIGGLVPTWVRLTHKRMELAVSLVAGFTLGIGLLHLLPHALAEMPSGQIQPVMYSLLLGFLVMFFVERFFCYHHHEVPQGPAVQAVVEGQSSSTTSQYHSHNNSCRHHNDTPIHNGHAHPSQHRHQLTWSGAAVGLTLHSLLEGVALAASVMTESHNRHSSWPGLLVLLAILLHKPFDSLSLTTLMGTGGWSDRSRHWVNAAFAMIVPLGVVLFHAGIGAFEHQASSVSPEMGGGNSGYLGYALAFAAGVFLCISMSDLLPELQFHSHDRGKLSFMLLLGLGLSWGISWFEARTHPHTHSHSNTPTDFIEHDLHDHAPHTNHNHE